MKKINKPLVVAVAATVALTGTQIISTGAVFAAETVSQTVNTAASDAVSTKDASEYIDITGDSDGNILAATSENEEKTAITSYKLNSDGSVPEDFLKAYEDGTLPTVYETNFIFNGVGAAVRVSESDDDSTVYETKAVKTNVLNINTTGKVVITGTNDELTIAVNTNGVTGDINLVLNGASITSGKKAPAIMVYNKDITYSKCNVTISTVAGTENTVTGGKLKKVSSMLTDNVSTYNSVNSQYGDTSSTLYYITNSDGTAFTSADKDKILFAECTADSEKIADGDPYTYYKYSGAISSDIDLNFAGEGSLTVKSIGDEGIESKGDINMTGGTGDYVVEAYDDCLNASTTGTEVNINVNSLTVQVIDSGEDDSEGDGIDSNGSITIDGGTVCAYAHPDTADSGLDAAESMEVGTDGSSGIHINGGTVISTSGSGSMMGSVSTDSSQMFATFTYSAQQEAGTKTTLKDTSGNVIFETEPLNAYQSIVFSSDKLTDGATYQLYCNDTLQQGYVTESSSQGGDGSFDPSQQGQGGNSGTQPTPPTGEGSTQPTDQGSTQPTGQGSTQPTDQGSTQPTGQESTQPTQPADQGGQQSFSGTATTLFTLTSTQNNVAGLTAASDDIISADQVTIDTQAAEAKTVTGTQASSTSTTYPKVSWDATEGVTGYQILCTYENSNGETTKVTKSVEGKTTYTFKTLTAGRTYTVAVRPYTTVDGTDVYGSWSDEVTLKVLADSSNIKTNIAKTKTVSNLKVTSTKAGIVKASWSKTSGVTGYQIKYTYINSAGKTVTKTKTIKSRSLTLKNLKSKKNCTIKVRTYTTINGTNIYGSYCTMKVKVK